MSEQTGTRVHVSLPVRLVALRVAPLFLAPVLLGTFVHWLLPDTDRYVSSFLRMLGASGGLYLAFVLAYWRMHKLDQKEKREEAIKHKADAHNAEA